MESITRVALLNAIVNEASIDGQTGATGRHPVATLNLMINRFCREARSLAVDAGGPWYQVLDAITVIPAAVTNEDFIEVPFPTTAIEIIGVDVQCTASGSSQVFPHWGSLDSADWSQRRQLNCRQDAPGGVGWWAVSQMPEARDAPSITAGKVALFPNTLRGNYRITYRDGFTDLSSDTSLFVGIVPMFTWVINRGVMVLTKRDTNKKDTYLNAVAEVAKAEARIMTAAKRVQTGGVSTPMRVGGRRLR